MIFLSSSQMDQDKKEITLRTRLGTIIGFTDFRNARIFYNIPYGKAPIGTRKFAKPEPFGGWNETRNGYDFSPLCPQVYTRFLGMFRMDVDCLILNIYTPVNVTGKLPVMVWIHGGGYTAGGAISYDGSALANLGNVVVVTINYRLGLEGFLSFGDRFLKGNYGIWDQILALEWVKNNIEDYGGNPEEVTIFGESAGGMSVSLLSLIPRNKGLFKRAIMQSGVANSVFAFQHDPADSKRAIAGQFGCPYNQVNPRASFECMQQVTMSTLVNATGNVISNADSTLLPVGPVVDEELFKRTIPEMLADKGSEELEFFRTIDIMVGTTDSDGSLLLRMGKAVQSTYGFNIITDGIPYHVFCNVFIQGIVAETYEGNDKVSEAMCRRYGRADDQSETSRQAVNMYTDMFFLSPAVEILLVHASDNKIAKSYQFVFSEWSLPFIFDAEEFPPWYQGAGHATDLIYLFFLEFMPILKPNITIDASDHKLAKRMRVQWTNFAKYGNPNAPGGAKEEWPQYDANGRQFLQLNKLNMTVGMDYRGNEVKFFLKTIPSILETANSDAYKFSGILAIVIPIAYFIHCLINDLF